MIQEGQLAYFKKIKGSYKPIGPARVFKKAWDEVAMLWGDPVFVFEVGPTHAKVSAKGHHPKWSRLTSKRDSKLKA
jgi:hypothetical protein